MVWFLILLLGLWLLPLILIRRAGLNAFDQTFKANPVEHSPEFQASVGKFAGIATAVKGLGPKERVKKMREVFDAFGDGDFGVDIQAVNANGVPGEWVTTGESDPNRRLLYLHGGAFMMGSAKSHRAITSEMAKRLNASVLAIDYRLQPEHSRRAGIDDTRTAWLWMQDNGPVGAAPTRETAIAGDSAGGNLSLTLSQWIRDQGLEPPKAVVGLAPLTDAAIESPSMKTNVTTDAVLGPMLGKITTKPGPLLFWVGMMGNRISPTNPVISPVRGDLANLPPTLLQADTSEMLLDDSVRYVNKAKAAGSVAQLQTFDGLMHVFHIVGGDVPEVKDAFDKIEAFCKQYGFGE